MTERLPFNLMERNDVRFDVTISTTDQVGGPDGPNIDVRFICESDDVEFSFKGEALNDGTVQVIVPPMKGVMAEQLYDARLEVIVEGHHFVPMKLEADFRVPVKVVAESARVVSSKQINESPSVVVKATTRQTPKTTSRLVLPKTKKNTKNAIDEMDKILNDL